MKLIQVISAISLIGLLGCQGPSNETVIIGKIIGDIPEKVEYTIPINGMCNWWFRQSVQPDSAGNFQIRIKCDNAVFIKLLTPNPKYGTLITEPGKTYQVSFDMNQKENSFAVTDQSSVFQAAYNKIPDPEHIQLGAREFSRDSVASRVKETIEQRRLAEIGIFEKFLSDKVISQDVFDLVKTDRNCYWDAVMATTAWLKDLRVIQTGQGEFTTDFENLWKESFKQPLFSNPKIVNSPWFNFYAECYIYFQEYMNGNFTKEKLDELNRTQQSKNNHVNKAKEYLPKEICENYLAYYLYNESIQKRYEKELIGLYADFKTQYPNSAYQPFISPLIDEIITFHQIADAGFNEKVNFVKNYRNLNTLAEITKTLPEGRVFIDVWATWCGPCKEEFQHKEALKKLMGNNNIPILYISLDRDRDSTQWHNMIKFYNLEGYHVRANQELDAELRKIYDNNGSISIPWYILVDNKGNILKKHASPPSQIEDLAKEINEQ